MGTGANGVYMKPVLSIELMVSNRKETVHKCIDSLDVIRQAVPCELIIIDTGCDSDLHTVLKKRADKLLNFTWCNDFSKARQVGLDVADGEWFMYLDDDEWFVETKELIEFFSSEMYKKYGSANYIQRNYLDFEGTQYSDCWVSRMTRINPDSHFESKIHEYLCPLEGNEIYLNAVVEHYGYVYASEEDKRKHFERNRILLDEMLEEDPSNERLKMQLVQEYRSINDVDALITLGSRYREEAISYGTKPCFYASEIIGLYGKKEYATLRKVCCELMEDKSCGRFAKSFAREYLALSYFWENKSTENCERAIAFAKEYIEDYEYSLMHNQELQIQKTIPFISEVFDEVKRKEIYSVLICAGLRLGDPAYLEIYKDELRWGDSSIYVFEAMADTLLEAMEEIVGREADKAFYHIVCRIWNHVPLREYFVEQMELRREKGQPVERAFQLFMKVKEADGIVKQLQDLVGKTSYETANPILEQIQSMLPYDERINKMLRENT